MAKTGANPNRCSSFNFYQLLRAVESRIIATENAKRMDVLSEEDPLNIQLIQELRQQRNELNCRGEGRLLGPGVHGGASTQQQSPLTIDQEMDEMVGQLKSLRLTKTELAVVVQSMPFLNRIRKDPKRFTALLNRAAAQSLAPEYEDWQSRTRPPQDS